MLYLNKDLQWTSGKIPSAEKEERCAGVIGSQRNGERRLCCQL